MPTILVCIPQGEQMIHRRSQDVFFYYLFKYDLNDHKAFVSFHLNNWCLVITYWNRICVILLVVISHFNIYSAIVNVFFFLSVRFTLLVRLSSSAEEWFNQCECASVPALLWVFSRQCCKTLMPYFQSCHILLIFSALPLQHPQCLPHIYSSFGQCETLDAWDFLKHTTLALLIVVCLFRPETRAKWQNKQHSGHAQAQSPDKRCTFTYVSPSNNILFNMLYPYP